MPTTPTEDEQAIREVATSFFADRAPLAKQLERDADSWRDLHEEMARLDFFSQSLPESAGGLGLSPLTSGLIAEAAGRELVPGPWLDQLIAVRMVAADESLAAPLVSAEKLAAVVFTRPGDEAPRHDAGAGTVSGVVHGVRFGDRVDVWLLSLPDAVVAIEAAAVGEVVVEPSIDPLWRSVSASLEDVPVIGVVARARVENEADLAFACGLVAALSVGGAARVLEDAIAYVKEREQFGRPIGSFQAIKHRAANAYISLLHARSLTCSALSDDDGERLHVARIAADGCYRQAAETALQLHGGIGFTAESSVHLFLKSAALLRGWPRPVERDLERVREQLGLDTQLEVAA